MRLHLSLDLSWHARGDAVFSWHRRTGDVCEMSRDVAALCLAFRNSASLESVVRRIPGIPRATVRSYCEILLERGVLYASGSPATFSTWAAHRPYVPARSIYEIHGQDVVVHGRALSVTLSGVREFLARADGTRRLDDSAPPEAWPRLLRLCEADLAGLKLLPPGGARPPWAESTMPWPEVDLPAFLDPALDRAAPPRAAPEDLAGYHAAIADPEAQFDEIETTLSHLFRAPHRALGGERFGDRLARGLLARGAPPNPRTVEVGGGLGYVGQALCSALAPRSYLVVDRSPALAAAQRRRGLSSVVGDALRLPIAERAVDLVISNEMAGDLGTEGGVNVGALRLVDECARVLAPGGLAWVSEFGDPTRAPVRSDHLDHDECSLRFDDLRDRAHGHGLLAELVRVPDLVRLDGAPSALVTTRASFAGLRRLFAARGAGFDKRAWLEDEVDAELARIGLDRARVHGLEFAPIGQRTMGLKPPEFWGLIARRPHP